MNKSTFLFVWTALAFVASCKQRPVSGSKEKYVAADIGARKRNTVLGIANQGSTPVKSFKEAIQADMSSAINFSHSASFSYLEAFDLDVTNTLDRVRQAAIDAGPNGTLVIFYSGHGYEGSGGWSIGKDELLFSQIVDAIKDVRKNNKLARLMVFSDSCYSGHLVNGEQKQNTTVGLALDDNTQLNTPPAFDSYNENGMLTFSIADSDSSPATESSTTDPLAVNTRSQIIAALMSQAGSQDGGLKLDGSSQTASSIANQYLVVASSRKDLVSKVMSVTKGGVLIYMLTKRYEAMAENHRRGRAENTIGQWIKETIWDANHRLGNGRQLPQFAVYPASLLNAYLFVEGAKNNVDIGKTVTPNANGVCPTTLDIPWAGTGRDASGKCLNDTNYCQCWPTATKKILATDYGCGFFEPGTGSSGSPVFYLERSRLVKNCESTCDTMVKMNRKFIEQSCHNQLLILNKDDKLEVKTYP